jgi:hypothetical protein
LLEMTMKKGLLFSLLAGFAILAAVAKHAQAGDGDSCTTSNGRSGYIIATGLTETCVASGE